MAISSFLKIALVALLGTSVVAHPKLSKEEMAEYQDLVARNTEALGRCLESRELRDINAAMLEHRRLAVRDVLKARGLEAREPGKEDVKFWLERPHEHQDQDRDPQKIWNFKWGQDEEYKNHAGCALAPESIYGPYWLNGQPRRQDIRTGKAGVYLRLAMQVIDIATCRPVYNARVDAWQADALGVYSTVNTGALRGYQPSSVYGTVDFDTIFPGHYPGRAAHIHVAVKPDGNKNIVHSGQIFFDDALREKVEATDAYKGNTAKVVTNIEDDFTPYAATKNYDPFAQWSYLGNDVKTGILAWIAMGVNLTAKVDQPTKRGLTFLDDHLDHSLHRA